MSRKTKEKLKFIQTLSIPVKSITEAKSPIQLVNNILPELFLAIRRIGSISKFYAKNGFLGIICTKVKQVIYIYCAIRTTFKA